MRHLLREALGVVLAGAVGAAIYLGVMWWMDRGGDDRFPADWLTEADQEQLADEVSTLQGKVGWAAGCVWPKGTEHDMREVVERVGLAKDTAWRPTLIKRTAAGNLLVVVTVASTPAVGAGFDEVSDFDHFCYRPVALPSGPTARAVGGGRM